MAIETEDQVHERASRAIPAAQQIRIVALQAAVSGTGNAMNSATVLARAREFEDFIRGTTEKPRERSVERQWSMPGSES